MTKNKKYKTLAIVPARGGSKSIPYKNIVDLGGRPLISYCLRAIKKSRTVGRLMVSTDDAKIARVAKKYGAEIPFLRPAELAQDSTPTIPVIEHTLKWLEESEGYKPDLVLLIEPTTPFVKAEQIDEAFKILIDKKANSSTTVISVPRIFHPYHVRVVSDKGFLSFEQPEMHYNHPSRQLDPKRYAHGNLWWFERDLFLKSKKIEVGKLVGLEIDAASAHDINDRFDLKMARILLGENLSL